MTDISKAEKLARAVDNFRSSGRSFDRQLAAQISKELRVQAARIAELEAALTQCRGMADEGTTAPNAAYRWCERIEEVAIAARPLPEYAEWSHTKEPKP